jgi:hypothetical protein
VNSVGNSPYAAGTYSVVRVVGAAAANTCDRVRFDGCMMGDLSGSVPNRSRYAFEWLTPIDASHPAWHYWQFSNNQYVWNANWLSDYGPLLDVTQNVNEVSCIHANNESYNRFGRAGHVGMDGWTIDVVPAGTAATNNAALYANSTTHQFVRDTTGYGTPVPPTFRGDPGQQPAIIKK